MSSDLKEFSFDSLRLYCVYVATGGSGYEKTTLACNIVDRLVSNLDRKFKRIVCMSPTLNSFKSCLPLYGETVALHKEFEEEPLKDLSEWCMENDSHGNELNSLVILDNCLCSKICSKSFELRRLFLKGKSMRVTLVITIQKCMDIPPALRSNIDVFFAGQDPLLGNRQSLWKHFGTRFSNFESFCMDMDNLGPHEWMVVVTDERARDEPAFHLGRLPILDCETGEPTTDEGEEEDIKLDLCPSILPLPLEDLPSFLRANEIVVALCGARRGFSQRAIDQWKEIADRHPFISFIYLNEPNKVQGFKVYGYPAVLTFLRGHLLHKKWVAFSSMNGVSLATHLEYLLSQKEHDTKKVEKGGIISAIGSVFSFCNPWQ